ncbi:methyltransferase domain-containing protein [Streptomyces sp. HNM0574]|uniref:class I SAM-dependent methyltransferase n=1 Tax=Streptomyces sp. HNM0574 TaxID=2714954 RepID=UPI00321692E7
MTSRLGTGRELRVLDAGPGRGEQILRLARSGHRVTGLADPDLLDVVRAALDGEPEETAGRVDLVGGAVAEAGARFAPGSFDVVLCHSDLTEAREPGNTLAGLARVLAPGGLLSVVVRNDDALAVHPARLGDWDAALAALDYPARAEHPLRRETFARAMSGAGTPLSAWYGIGVFSSGPSGDGPDEPDPRMLDAEERAGRTDPYRSVAALLHLCGVRG